MSPAQWRTILILPQWGPVLGTGIRARQKLAL